MKNLMVFAVTVVAMGASFVATAQDTTARVISSVPVVQQVAVTRQACSQVAVPSQVPGPTSGAGGVMGAIVGGVLGNQIGHGGGRAAATVLGTVGGALLGNSIEGAGNAGTSLAQNCTPQVFHENRTVGYDVTYEYNGQQQTVRMANDPGPTLRMQVTPVGAVSAGPVAPRGAQPLVTAPPIAQATVPAPVVITEPLDTVVYPSYAPAYSYAPRAVYPSYWYPPISLSFGYVYGGGRHWHGHRRWR